MADTQNIDGNPEGQKTTTGKVVTDDSGRIQKLPYYEMLKKGADPETLGGSFARDKIYLEDKNLIVGSMLENGATEVEVNERYNIIKAKYEASKMGVYSLDKDDISLAEAEGDNAYGFRGIADIYNIYEPGSTPQRVNNNNMLIDQTKFYTMEDGKKVEHDMTFNDKFLNPGLVIHRDKDSMGNPIGDPYILQADATDNLLREEPYLAFTTQKVYGESWVDLFGGFVSGAVNKGFIQTFTKLGLIGDNFFFGKNEYDPKKVGVDPDNITEAGLNYVDNLSRRWEYKPSEKVLEGGWGGSFHSFLYNLSEGLGEYGVQIAVSGGIETAAKKGATTAAKKVAAEALLKASTKDGAKLIMNKSLKANALNSLEKYALFGTMQAMAGNYEEMIRAGYSEKDASRMSVLMAPAVYLTERFVGTKWLKKKFGYNEYGQAVREYGERVLGKMAKHEATKLSTDGGVKQVSKGISKRMIDVGKKLFTKDGAKAAGKGFVEGVTSAPGKASKTIKGLYRGGVKGVMEAGAKMENKFPFEYGNPITMIKGALGEGNQEALEQSVYMMGYYMHDNTDANKFKKYGEGSMGYHNFFYDVWGDKGFKELKDNWIGGATIGGFAAGVMRGRNKKVTDENYLAIAGYHGELDMVEKAMLENSYIYGSKDMNPDYGVMEKNGSDPTYEQVAENIQVSGQTIFNKGQELKSMHDVNLYHALLDVNLVRSLIEEQGFPPEYIASFTGQEGMLVNGFQQFKKYKEAKTKVEELTKNIKDASDEKKESLNKELEEQTKIMNDAKEKYDYYIAPDNEKNQIKSKIKDINDRISTLEQSRNEENNESVDYQIKINNQIIDRLTKSLNNIEDTPDYSKAYKDNLKSTLSLMYLANQFAVKKLGYDEKFKDVTKDSKIKLKNSEIDKFDTERGSFLYSLKKNDVEPYSIVEDIESKLDVLTDNIITSLSENKIDKEKNNKALELIDKAKNKIKEIGSGLNKNNSPEELLGHISNISESIKTTLEGIDFAQYGTASAIESSFNELQSLIQETTSNDVFNVEEFNEETLQQVPEASLINQHVKFAQAEVSSISLKEAANAEKENERLRKMSIDELREFLLYNEIDNEIERLKKIFFDEEGNVIDNVQTTENPIAISNRLDQYRNKLNELKLYYDIRQGVITPLKEGDESKFLSRFDKEINKEEYDRNKEKIENLSTDVKALLDIVDNMIKINSNYFKMDRINKAHMNKNALTVLFDNQDFLETTGLSDYVSALKSIIIPNPENTEDIDDETTKELVAAERAINSIKEKVWEKREFFNNKIILKSLLENSFLNPELFDKQQASVLNESILDSVSKEVIELNMRDYGNSYNPGELGQNHLYSFLHFAQMLVELSSDFSPSQINNTRKELYKEHSSKYVSSTEQIVGENTTIAFILGGNKLFDLLVNIEEELKNDRSGDYTYLDNYIKNTIMLTGKVQTGKTQQMTPQIMAIVNKLNSDSKFVFVSYSKDSVDNYNNIKDGVTEELSNKISNIDVNDAIQGKYDNNAILFWDEATLLTNKEQKIIKENQKEKGNIIVFMGDGSQMRTLVGPDAQKNSNISYVGLKTNPAIKKFATDNPLLMDLMDYYDTQSIVVGRKSKPKAWSEVVDGVLRGIEYKKSISDVIDNFLGEVQGKDAKNDISLVFLSEVQAKKWINEKPELENYKQYITVLSADKADKTRIFDTIQGGRRSSIFLAYDGSKEETIGITKFNFNPNNALYTLVGRASNFISLVGDVTEKYNNRPANFVSQAETVEPEETRTDTINWLNEVYDEVELEKPSEEKNTEEKSEVFKTNRFGKPNERQSKRLNDLSSISEMGENKNFTDDGSMKKTNDNLFYHRISHIVGGIDISLSDVSKFNNKGNKKLKANKSAYEYVNNQAKAGTMLDAIARDFMSENLKNWDEYKYDNEQLVFSNEGVFDFYIKELESLAEYISNKDEIPFAGKVRLYYSGSENITGEPDLITVDKKGHYHIYDYKSKLDYNGASPYFKVDIKTKYNSQGESAVEMAQEQMSAYSDLLAHHEYWDGKSKPKISKMLTILFMRYSTEKDNAPTINFIPNTEASEVSAVRRIVEYVETNVTEVINEDLKDEDVEEYTSQKTYSKNKFKIAIGKTYKDSEGNEYIVSEIRKYNDSKKVEIVVDNNGEETIYEGNDFVNMVNITKEDIETKKDEINDANIETPDTIVRKSAMIFATSNGMYSTPISIPSFAINENIITEDEIEEYRAFKGIFLSRLKKLNNISFKLTYNKNKAYFDDNGNPESFNDVITIDITNENDIAKVINKMPSSKILTAIKKYKNKTGSYPQSLLEVATLGQPEVSFPVNGKSQKLDLSLSIDEEANVIRKGFNLTDRTLFKNPSEAEKIIQENIDFNIMRAIVFNKARNGEDLGTVMALSNTSNGILHKGDNTNLDEFVSNNSKRGFNFNAIEFVKINGKVYLSLKYNFDGNIDSSDLLIRTKKINNDSIRYKLARKLKEDLKLIKDLKKKNKLTLKDMNDLMNRTNIRLLMLSNHELFAKENIQALFDNKYRFDGKYFNFNKGEKKAKNIVQTELNNVEDVINTLMTYLDNTIDSSKALQLEDLRMLFNKNEEFSNIDLSDFEINGSRINIPESYFIPDISIFNMNTNNEEEDDDFEPPFSIKTNDVKGKQIATEQAKTIISNILGDIAAEEWSNFTPNLNANGLSLFGMMKNGMLHYNLENGLVNEPTVRHEIFHLVHRYLLSDESREEIIKEAREVFKVSNNTTDEKVEEMLANWYGANGENYNNENRYKGLLGSLRKLVDKILGRYELYSGRLFQLFNKIETGGFKGDFNNLVNGGSIFETEAHSTIGDFIQDNEKVLNRLDIKRNSKLEQNAEYVNAVYEVLGTNDNLQKANNELSKRMIGLSYLFGKNRTIDDAINVVSNMNNTDKYSKKKIGRKKITNITSLELGNLTDEEFSNYILYHLNGNENFRKGIILSMFPNYDFDKSQTDKVKDSTQYDKKSNSVGASTNEYIKFFLKTIPFFEYEKGIPKQTGKIVDAKMAEEILYKAGELIAKNGSGDLTEDFEEALGNMVKNNGTVYDNTIKSLIERLYRGYKKGMLKGNNEVKSLAELSNPFNRTTLKLSFDNAILDDAENLLTAIISNYSSAIKRNITKVTVKNNNIDNVTVKRQRTSDEQKQTIKSTVINTLYNYDGFSIRDKVKERFNKTYYKSNKRVYRLKSDGFYIGGEKIIEVYKDSNGVQRYKFINNSLDVITKLQILTGLTDITISSINDLKDGKHKIGEYFDNADFLNNFKHLQADEFLAMTFMNFLWAIDSNIEQETALEEKVGEHKGELPAKKEVNKILSDNFTWREELSNIMGNLAMKYDYNEYTGELDATNVDSQARAIMQNGDVTTDVNVKTIKPTDFYSLIDILGQVNYANKILGRDNFIFVGNKKMWAYELKNNILETLGGNNLDITKIINDKIREAFNTNMNNNLFINDKGLSTNSFIRNVEQNSKLNQYPNLSASIVEISELPGLSNDYRSVDDLTYTDNLRSIMAAFVDSLKKNKANTSTITIPLGYNERSYLVTVELSYHGGFVNTVFNNDGTINYINLNKPAVINGISKIFEYYNQSALASYDRWKSFLDISSENFALKNILSKFKKKTGKSVDFNNFGGSENRFVLTEMMEAELTHSNLIEQLDYYITNAEDDKGNQYRIFGFGNAIRFVKPGVRAINYKNYNKIQSKLSKHKDDPTGNEVFNLINKLFQQDKENDFSKYQSILGYEDRYGLKDLMKKHYPDSQGGNVMMAYQNRKAKVRVVKDTVFNPFADAFFYSMFILNHDLDSIVYGNTQASKSMIDYTKRNNPSKTGKTLLNFSHSKALAKVGRLIPVASLMRTRTDEDMNGMNVKSNDGSTLGFMLHQIAMVNSLGGEKYSKFDRTMYKPLRTGVNYEDGVDMQFKEAIDYTSSEEAKKQPLLAHIQHNLVKIWSKIANDNISLWVEENSKDLTKDELKRNNIENIDLYSEFLSELRNNDNDIYKALETLWNDLMDVSSPNYNSERAMILRESIPEGFSDETVIKRGKRAINTIDITKPLTEEQLANIASIKVDNRNFGIVNNPGHNIDSFSSVAIPNQVLSHMGVGSNNRARGKRINEHMMNIQRIGKNNLFKKIGVKQDIDSWDKKDIAKIGEYMKTLSIHALSQMGASGVIELLQNGADIQLPQIANTIKNLFRSHYNDAVYKPRFSGYRANQASGVFHRVYVDNNGAKYTYANLLKQYDNNAELLDKEISTGVYSQRELNYMHYEGDNFIHSEVIAPYMYTKEFYINDDEDVSDVYTLNLEGGNENINSLVENAIDNTNNKKEAITKIYSELEKIIEEEEGILDSPALRYIMSKTHNKFENGIILVGEARTHYLRELAKYYYNFGKSLDVVVNRVPYDNPALGFTARIVGFSQGNGNTIYINTLENIRTGADQDIDQLSVYFKSLDENLDEISDDNKMESHQNKIIDEINSYYSDKTNRKLVFGVTSTKTIEDLSEEILDYNARRRFRNRTTMHGLSSILQMNDNINEGKDAISILALMSSAYGYLIQNMNTKAVGPKMYLNVYNNNQNAPEVLKRVQALSSFLQAALDNPKIMALGSLGIPKKATGLIVSLIAMGKTEQEIAEMFNKEALEGILWRIKKSSNIDEKSLYIPEITKLEINSFKAGEKNTYALADKIMKENKEPEITTYQEYAEYLKASNEVDAKTRRYAEDIEESNTLYKEITERSEKISKLEAAANYKDNFKLLNDFYDAAVYSEALRRFGQIVSLRKGLIANELKKDLKIKEFELSFGMPIQSVLDGNTVNKEEFLQYYKDHSNQYRKSENKEMAINIEADVYNALKLDKFVQGNNYFLSMLAHVNDDTKMMQKIFAVNSPRMQELTETFMKKQNRAYAEYAQQLVSIHGIVNELIVDSYFKNPNVNKVYDIRIPDVESNSAVAVDDTFREVNLSSSEGRALYLSQFPYLAQAIKDIAMKADMKADDIKKFFNKIGITVTTKEANNILRNEFFDVLHINGYEGFNKIYIDSGLDADENRRIEMANKFASFPEDVKHLFRLHTLLDHKMVYTTKGLDILVGPDLVTDVSKNTDLFRIMDKFDMNKVINTLGSRNNLRRAWKEEDPAYFVSVMRQINNSFMYLPHIMKESYDKEGDIERIPITYSNTLGGYDSKVPLNKIFYEKVNKNRLSNEQEDELRRTGRTIRKFPTGAYFVEDYGVTSSGMLVSNKMDNRKTTLIIKSITGDEEQKITNDITKVKDNNLKTLINLNWQRKKLLNGELKFFDISSRQETSGSVINQFKHSKQTGKKFKLKGKNNDLFTTLNVEYLGNLTYDETLQMLEPNEKKFNKLSEAQKEELFLSNFGKSKDDVFKSNFSKKHIYKTDIFLEESSRESLIQEKLRRKEEKRNKKNC